MEMIGQMYHDLKYQITALRLETNEEIRNIGKPYEGVYQTIQHCRKENNANNIQSHNSIL